MILQIFLMISMANACPSETKPKMFVLTACSQCRKTYQNCLETLTDKDFDSKEAITCQDAYVSCFRENKCQSEHR